MNEMEHYKSTLALIEKEAEMFLSLKYGTPELELRMKSTSLLKIQLFARNALQQFSPVEMEAKKRDSGGGF